MKKNVKNESVNLSAAIIAANECLKKCKELRDANREHTSVSRVLKDIQRADELRAGYLAAFSAVGYNHGERGALTPQALFDMLQPEQWLEATKGRGKKKETYRVPCIWSMRQARDNEGNKLFEADGTTPIMVEVATKITTWSPTKVFRLLAQAAAILSNK